MRGHYPNPMWEAIDRAAPFALGALIVGLVVLLLK